MRRTFFYITIVALLIVALSPVASFAVQSDSAIDSQTVAVNPAIIKTKKELEDLAKKIDIKGAEILVLSVKLESSSKEIISSYQRLKVAERELRDQQIILNRRIIEVYKNRSNFIVLLLTSRSLRDVWTRMAFLSRVNRVDRGLLAKNKQKVDEVDDLKNSIAQKKDGLLETRREKVSELAYLRLEFDKKKTKLSTLATAAKPAKPINSQVPFSLLGR